jgi:peptide/nickel transport system permease protein
MGFVLKRVAASLVLIWLVASIVFLAIRLVPGDPAEMLLSQGGMAPDPAAVAALRTQLGLDRSMGAQYVLNFRALLTGDLGQSLVDDSPVSEDIGQRLPRTLELIGAATLFAVVVGVPGGLLAALRRGGALDRGAAWIAALALATPVFVVGTLMVLLFAQTLRWVPAGGTVPFATDPARHLLLLAMPAVAIGLGLAASVFRMTRASVLDVAGRDHVRTAHAKGVAPGRIWLHHILRNALTPIVTVVALNLGTLLGGTVLVEYVFNYPGISGLLIDAVNARDYPTVQGVVLVISILLVLLNLCVDLLYAVLDPRIRHA